MCVVMGSPLSDGSSPTARKPASAIGFTRVEYRPRSPGAPPRWGHRSEQAQQSYAIRAPAKSSAAKVISIMSWWPLRRKAPVAGGFGRGVTHAHSIN
ncbi:hypothetical protein GCM10022284_11820 [Streptomyces hundungensis]